MEIKIDFNKIKAAEYNPRKITENEMRGLNNSMHEFGDISGITYNALTGNLIAGHQRYELLKREHSGVKFIHLKGEFFNIVSDKGETGYTMRVVEWDAIKEKAANIAANAHTIQGKFDLEKLPFVLEDVIGEFPNQEFNFDILSKDFGLSYEPEVTLEERKDAPRENNANEDKLVCSWWGA